MPVDVGLIVILIGVTFFIGALVGFIGAGGAGVMVSLLAIGFQLPIHQAVGTALAAMLAVTAAGAVSHFREGNVALRAGGIIGLTGMVGALVGATLGQFIPEDLLQPLAGFALWFLAYLVWLRSRVMGRHAADYTDADVARPNWQVPVGSGLGAIGGMLSAFFGVGMAPFLQLSLMTVFRLSLARTIGTTMFALVFISASGSLALASYGEVSVSHLVGASIGMTAGSYVGAKLTRRAPLSVLRAGMVGTPAISGALLIFL